MPEVLTATLALTIAASAARTGARANSSMSAEGEFSRAQVTQVWDRFEETISFQSPHQGLLTDIENLAAEHSLNGWDGGDAPAISDQTVQNACAFLSSLPSSLPSPTIAVDPNDAALSFEWYGGHRRVLSVSIGDSGRLACAGLDGTNQWYAALNFDGELPPMVIDGIRRVCA